MKKIITLAAIAMMVLSAQAANITIAQAVEIGNALKDGGVTSETYTVEGYVVKLQDAYDNEKGDQCWFMSDDKNATYGEFEAYWCYIDKAVKVGDKVTVTGKITKYVSKDKKVTIEIKNGQAKLVSGTSGGSDTGKGTEIKGMSTVMAYYYEDETDDGTDFFWDFDMAADNEDYIPRVYFSCYNSTPTETSIVGEWEIFYCIYVRAKGDTIYSDDYAEEGGLSVTYKGKGTYHFEGQMLGEDGNTYVWTIETNDVTAVNDDEGEEIILEEDETPIQEVKYTKTIIKKIENGQVTIVRDDIRYNVQGSRLN